MGCSVSHNDFVKERLVWLNKLDKFWEYYSIIEDSLNLSKAEYLLFVKGCEGCYEGSTPTLYVFTQNSNNIVRRIDILEEYSIKQRYDSNFFYGVLNYLKCMSKDSIVTDPEYSPFSYYDIKIKINEHAYHYWVDNFCFDFDDKYVVENGENPMQCLKNLTVYIRSLLPKGEFNKK